MSNEVALFCVLRAGSVETRDRLLSLLESATSYYRSPKAHRTAWCYFTPSLRPGAFRNTIDAEGPDAKCTMITAMQIFNDTAALETQAADTAFFPPYQAAVKTEGLYAKPEEVLPWYPRAGPPVVVLARIFIKDGMMERFLENYAPFADWVQARELDTLSYAIFTRPKAPNQVLVFERYVDAEAFEIHKPKRSGAFREMFKKVRPFVEKMDLDEWDEVGGSFAGVNGPKL